MELINDILQYEGSSFPAARKTLTDGRCEVHGCRGASTATGAVKRFRVQFSVTEPH